MLIVVRLLVLLIASSCVGKRLPGALADLPGGSASNEQLLNKGNDGHGSLPLDSIAKMINGDLLNKGTLKELNDARAAVARELSIANMHQLKWSDHQAALAGKLCADADIQFTGRAFLSLKDREQEEELNEHVFSQMAQNGTWPEYMGVFELLHPLQKSIGCARVQCEIDGNEVDGVCVLGVAERFRASDIKRGTPGSECFWSMHSGGLCTTPFDHPKRRIPSGDNKRDDDFVHY